MSDYRSTDVQPARSHSRGETATPPPDRNTQSHAAYLSALRQIDRIPVPDLASTLTTPAAHEVSAALDEPSLSYMRTQLDAQSHGPFRGTNTSSSRPHQLTSTTTTELLEAHRQRITRLTDNWRSTMEERDARLDRLERVLAQLNRMQSDRLLEAQRSERAPNEPGRPVPTAQDVRDVLEAERQNRPSSSRSVEDMMRDEGLRQLRLLDAENARTLRNLRSSERELRNRYMLSSSSGRRSPSAITNSQYPNIARHMEGRRHPRLWNRHRDGSQRDSTATNYPSAEANRSTVDVSSQTSNYPWTSSSARDSTPPTQPAQSSRNRYRIDELTTNAVSDSNHVQDTLLYLSRIRQSDSLEENMMHACNAGFNYSDFKSHDFVRTIDDIKPPAATSILGPGTTFSGSQFANSSPPDYLSSTYTHPGYNRTNATTLDHLFPGPTNTFSSSMFGPSRPSDTATTTNGNRLFMPPYQSAHRRPANATGSTTTDSWPVKVTIYDVDYDAMTLSACMEAFDVPAHPLSNSSISSGSSGSSSISIPPSVLIPPTSPHSPCASPAGYQKIITTYLEGEILDFRTHTFVTQNFNSSLARDAHHWRKLPPFKRFSAAELPAKLLSREFLNNLADTYLLMRWKERCFVSCSGEHRHSHGVPAASDASRGGSAAAAAAASASVPGPDATEGCGLTISGFYYVSMRREDGVVEGLYSDPQSSPYQFLTLRRAKGCVLPSWEFR